MKLKFENGQYGGSREAWQNITSQIHKRSEGKCEFCGVQNCNIGRRNSKGEFKPVTIVKTGVPVTYKTYKEAKTDAEHWNDIVTEECIDNNETPPKKLPYFVIVLTVAHIDHDATNNNLGNLKHLCQKCYLQHDATQHKENSHKTLQRKKQLTNTLF